MLPGHVHSISCAELELIKIKELTQISRFNCSWSEGRTVEKLRKAFLNQKRRFCTRFYLLHIETESRHTWRDAKKHTAELSFNIHADAMTNIKSFTFLRRRSAQSRWSSRITVDQARADRQICLMSCASLSSENPITAGNVFLEKFQHIICLVTVVVIFCGKFCAVSQKLAPNQ